MRTSFATLGMLALMVASCATPPSSGYPDIELTVLGQQTNPTLASRLNDETEALEPVSFKTKDGVLAGAVLAAGTVQASKAARGYMVRVGLGREVQPLLCTVQEGVLGLSAFARSLTDAFLASHEAYELKYAFAGTDGGLPYLVVHGQYIDGQAEGKDRKTGFLKMVIAGRAERTIACFHDQFGYRKTVERVSLSLIDKLTWAGAKPLQPLVRRSVYALRADGEAAGSREVVIRSDAEDFRRGWIRTAFLSLQGPQALNARDVVETYDSDPDGRLYSQTYQVKENGKVLVDLTLEERPMTDYEVTGKMNEQEVKARFTAPEGLPGLLKVASYRLTKQTFSRFTPEASPRQPTASEVQKADASYRIQAGNRVTSGQLDASGHWVNGKSSDGYTFERTSFERGPKGEETEQP